MIDCLVMINMANISQFFTMFHFLEYPFSRGETFITSPSAYDAPDFDAGFMNDKRDMAPMGKLNLKNLSQN